MRRLALLGVAFAVAFLAAGMVVQAPTAQTASPGANGACRSGEAVIPAAALPETVDLDDCPIGGRVIRDHGVGTVLPAPGQSIYVEAMTTDGAQELEVARYRGGTLELERVGDETVDAREQRSVTSAASSQGECKDRAYTDLDMKVESTLPWSFNSGTTPAELNPGPALDAIERAGANITNTRNNCRLGDNVPATLTYEGDTNAHAQIDATGNCAGPDSETVVSFGDLPASTLAVTCTVSIRNPDGYNPVTSSDIMINKTDHSWTTRPGARSCESSYDLQGVVTHERGHTFGLGHVLPESEHGKLTMSDRNNGFCQTSERTLGRGDVLGLKVKYSQPAP